MCYLDLQHAVQCGAVQCGAVRCGAVQYGADSSTDFFCVYFITALRNTHFNGERFLYVCLF
jgi:hypothetical protein